MDSQTWYFEDTITKQKYYFHISGSEIAATWLIDASGVLTTVAGRSNFKHITGPYLLPHADYYEDEEAPHSEAYLLLQKYKYLHLARFQEDIILMYHYGLKRKEVCDALDVNSDWLKKQNKLILKETGVKGMKSFASKKPVPVIIFEPRLVGHQNH